MPYKSKETRRERCREYNRLYKQKQREDPRFRELARIRSKRHYWKHQNKYRIAAIERNQKIKDQIFNHYGKKCACCGEEEQAFLCIDHINGGGNRHRKLLGREGISFYRWLIWNKFPDGYRTLCHNCNHAISKLGQCPHLNLMKGVSK